MQRTVITKLIDRSNGQVVSMGELFRRVDLFQVLNE